MKKILALILALILCLSTVAFAEATMSGEVVAVEETADTKYQKTITIAPSLSFTNWDVQNNNGGTDKSVYVTVFDTLVEFDTVKQEYVPGLAESWEQLADTQWKFNLRQGVKFHDGNPFTAEDVKFSVERGLEQSGSKGKYSSIKEVTIVDEYTVIFDLYAPNNDLIYMLCEPNTSMLCKKTFEEQGDEAGNKNGTGPFKFNEWIQGDYLSLVRFDEFWGGKAKTEEIKIREIPEASSRLIALQTGEIDIAIDPPAIDLHYVAEDPNLVLWQIPSTNIRHIFLNLNVEPFTNPLVRQAVAHAIDRESLVILVYEGNAQEAVNCMHTISEFYADVPYYEYDPEKAIALLAEAGYPDGFSTEIYSSTGTTQKAVAAVIQAQLAEVGIDVTINSLETATFNAGVGHGGTYPIAVDGWGGHAIGPDYALRTIFHTEGSVNRSNIEDPAIDKLIDDALAETDYETRKALYAEIQEFIMGNANWLPLAIEQINVGLKNTVQGFELPLGLHHHWRNLYIVEE